MPAIAAEVLQEFELESATTRRLLERVPADQLNWKPHPKSRSVCQLASLPPSRPAIGIPPPVERSGAGDLWPECGRKPYGRWTGLMWRRRAESRLTTNWRPTRLRSCAIMSPRRVAHLERYAQQLLRREGVPLNRARRWILAGVWAGILVMAGGCEPRPPDSTVSERNRALVLRWIEDGFNQQDMTEVDELFSERFAVNGQVIGRDGLKANMTRHLIGFPDLHVTVDDIVAEGSKVGIWYTVEGTHRGEFEGFPATGARVKWSGYDLLSIEEGKFAEARFLSDSLGLLTQLGATVAIPGNANGAR